MSTLRATLMSLAVVLAGCQPTSRIVLVPLQDEVDPSSIAGCRGPYDYGEFDRELTCLAPAGTYYVCGVELETHVVSCLQDAQSRMYIVFELLDPDLWARVGWSECTADEGYVTRPCPAP